jgi:predicted dehydrogenase
MRFGVLGSGFGLYGYLPALVAEGHEVCLPARYRNKLLGRSELCSFDRSVEWCENLDAMLGTVDGLVLAVRPYDQITLVKRALSLKRLTHLLLEKPIAPTPEMADAILRQIEKHGIIYRIGYTFNQVAWLPLLTEAVRSERKLHVRWEFQAHHYASNLKNWKRFDSSGGGGVRFFGIHLLSLLAQLGYTDVEKAEREKYDDECPAWSATFAAKGLALCEVSVNSRSPTEIFAIDARTNFAPRPILNLKCPFDLEERFGLLDTRVGATRKIIKSLLRSVEDVFGYYESTNRLWGDVERLAADVN